MYSVDIWPIRVYGMLSSLWPLQTDFAMMLVDIECTVQPGEPGVPCFCRCISTINVNSGYSRRRIRQDAPICSPFYLAVSWRIDSWLDYASLPTWVDIGYYSMQRLGAT